MQLMFLFLGPTRGYGVDILHLPTELRAIGSKSSGHSHMGEVCGYENRCVGHAVFDLSESFAYSDHHSTLINTLRLSSLTISVLTTT